MVNERMKRLGTARSAIRELFEYGNARAKQIGRENVFDFSLGNPSVPAPPAVRAEIERLLNEEPAEVLHGYTSAPGDMSARKAVSDYILKTFGVSAPAENIYMTCGASASLTTTIHALCVESGDEFIVLAPYFPEYRVFIEGAGGKVVEVQTDENFRLDSAALKAAIGNKTRAVLINSPNNPSGVVYKEEELRALADVLNEAEKRLKRAIYLISDEPYRELSYGFPVPYPAAYYRDTVSCYSFSKSLSLAGERIGYVAVHEGVEGREDVFAAICGAGRDLGFVCAPSLFQRVAAKCIGMTSDLSVYRRNRDLLYGKLTDMGFTCASPDGAFYLFLKSPEEDANAFCERAKKYELLLVPSDSFGVKGYVRIAYCVSEEQVARSIPAFEKLAKEYNL